MKTDLGHLPENKQAEIKQVVEVIHSAIKAEMIILFGSYARGNWVEDLRMDHGRPHEYRSDYDILVIPVKDNLVKEYQLDDMVEQAIDFETPVNIILHTLKEVGQFLAEGNYFFTDIVKEGIMLFDTGKYTMKISKELTEEEKAKVRKEDFEEWFKASKEFLTSAKLNTEISQLKVGAFNLHQAAEKALCATLLYYTGYKPRLHNLKKLINIVAKHNREVANAIPRTTPEDVHLFSLLQRGYIDSRYKKNYFINKEELEKMIENVERLQEVVERIG